MPVLTLFNYLLAKYGILAPRRRFTKAVPLICNKTDNSILCFKTLSTLPLKNHLTYVHKSKNSYGVSILRFNKSSAISVTKVM